MRPLPLVSVPVLLSASAFAGSVTVHATGTVGFSSASGGVFAGVQAGDPVAMSWNVATPGVDVQPGDFETFPIDKPTFLLDIGGAQAGLGSGAPSLGISDGFPVADGAFIFLTPLNVGGQIEFELHDSTGTAFHATHVAALAGSYPGAAFDSVDWNVFTGGGQIAIALTGLVFDHEVAPPLGTSYCTSTPNSSGQAALITAAGSASVAARHLTLTGTRLPAFKHALFFYGPQQAQTPLGSGSLCVGGGVFRMQPAVLSDALGTVVHVVDWTQPPVASGSGAILAGSTWNFQSWFRDGATTNLTDAVAVTFVP